MVASNKNIGTLIQLFHKALIKELKEANKSLSSIAKSLGERSTVSEDKAEDCQDDGDKK